MTRRASPPEGPAPRAAWGPPVLVFLLALVVRLGHVWSMRASPYFAHPVLDAETYYRSALALARGEGFPDPIFWQPPGYPYFLASLFALAGPGFLHPRLAQAVCGALTAVLTYAIGDRLFGRRVGLAAGLGVGLYGPLIFFDGELLTPSLAIVLQTSAIYLAVRAQTDDAARGWLGAGLFGGATALVTAPALVIVPVIAVCARRRAGWVLLGAALAIAPATLRNWTQGGELILISSNAGVNLFIGNNPRYDATVALRPGRDWQALLRAPRLHGVRGAAGGSRFFVERVVDFARTDPLGFARLQAKKLYLVVAGNEIPRNHEMYPARAYSPVLRLLLWKVPGLAVPWGILLPLAALGLVVGAPRAPMLAGCLLGLALTVLAFFVTARYRAPLVPLLAVFAAEGGRWWLAETDRVRRAFGGMLVIPLFALANVGQGPMPARMNPDAEFGLAIWMQREGRPAEALALYESVVRAQPNSWDAWFGLGQLLASLGRGADAEEALRRASRTMPEHFDTLAWMASRALRAGCPERASVFARKGLALEPRSALARSLLAEAEDALRGTPPAGRAAACPPPPADGGGGGAGQRPTEGATDGGWLTKG